MVTGGCANSDYAAPDTTCDYVQVGRRHHSHEGRTFGAWDFNTSNLPDDAVIQSVEFSVYVADVYTKPQMTPPGAIVTCELDIEWEVSQAGEILQIGYSSGPVDSIGHVHPDSVPYAFVTECPHTDSESNYLGAKKAGDKVSRAGAFHVSKVGTTRIKIDSELAPEDIYALFSFFSMRHASNKPAELRVTWRPAYEFYGATLGSAHWAGFDTLLVPDLVSSSSYEKLDETLPIYLVWQTSDATGGQPEKLAQPVRIDSTSWWGTTGFAAQDFSVDVEENLDQEYHACPSGEGVQATLNTNGTLTVQDLNFGGIGSGVRIELRSTDPDPQRSLVRVIVLQWDNPGTYFDAELEQNVDAAPDGSHSGIVTLAHEVQLLDQLTFPVHLPTRIVEWVSTDISGVSIRVVDEADLAVLSDELGHAVSWGFGTETRNYHVNTTMFGNSALYIDASDLAMMVADVDDDSCGVTSKIASSGSTATESNKDKILAWFGIAATGEMVPVGPAGELLPGYAIVDLEKNRRAIADPYGWRDEEP